VTSSTAHTHLALEGLHCAGCSTATEKALRALPGVHEVTVDLLSASIEHDPDQTSVDDLIAAVEHEGFTAARL
jgi:copper chaperone CopZ